MQTMLTQVIKGATFIENIIKSPELAEKAKRGIYFLGISQGGVIARMIFNLYDEISDYVKRIVTLGTPNSGIEKVEILDSDFQNGIVNFLLTTNWAKRNFSAAFYSGKNDTKSLEGQNIDFNDFFFYLNCSNVKELTNIFADSAKTEEENAAFTDYCEICAKIKFKYSQLELFMTVMYVDDKMILPPNSAIFGQNHVTNNVDQLIQRVQGNILALKNTRKIYLNLLNEINITKPFVPSLESDFNKVHYKVKSIENQIYVMSEDLNYINNTKMNTEREYSFPISLADTKFYKDDILSIQTLTNNSRYLSCSINQPHVSETEDDFISLGIRPFTIQTPHLPFRYTDEELMSFYAGNFINPDDISYLQLYCDFSLLKSTIDVPQRTMSNVLRNLALAKNEMAKMKAKGIQMKQIPNGPQMGPNKIMMQPVYFLNQGKDQRTGQTKTMQEVNINAYGREIQMKPEIGPKKPNSSLHPIIMQNHAKRKIDNTDQDVPQLDVNRHFMVLI
jgi:hypothetical protein